MSIGRNHLLAAVGVAILALAALALPRSREAREPGESPPPAAAPAMLNRVEAGGEIPQRREPRPAPEVAEKSTEAGDARIAELAKLAWFDDPASLREIVKSLRDPDPKIRAAALAAVRSSGSRDAIPALKSARDDAADEAARAGFQDVIDYLELPTFLEELEARGPTPAE